MKYLLYTLLVAIYFFFMSSEGAKEAKRNRWRWLFKSLPILLLAGIAFTQLTSPLREFVTGALLLSAGGDIALATDHKRSFVLGLGLFLLAHVAYAFGFLQSARLTQTAGFQGSTVWLLLSIGIFAVGMAGYLYPHLGKLKIPVLIYVGAIALMGISAVLFTPFTPLLIFGTVIFMSSDSMIALDKFVAPLQYRDWLVMGTYYLAQFLILFSLVS